VPFVAGDPQRRPRPRTGMPSERRRVIVSTCAGCVGGGLVAAVSPWQAAVLVGFDLASAVLVVGIWRSVGPLDSADTLRLATREDDSRASSWFVVILACTASLVGVLAGIIKARALGGTGGDLLIASSILAVALAWITVHTIFTLRYAHRFYSAGGGIDFPGADAPSYLDFAYLAFTVGMTFQVSDTNLVDPDMRWLVLRHAALSYVFGTAVIGLTINLLGGLLG